MFLHFAFNRAFSLTILVTGEALESVLAAVEVLFPMERKMENVRESVSFFDEGPSPTDFPPEKVKMTAKTAENPENPISSSSQHKVSLVQRTANGTLYFSSAIPKHAADACSKREISKIRIMPTASAKEAPLPLGAASALKSAAAMRAKVSKKNHPTGRKC